MTLQQFYALLADYRPAILLFMLIAPWVSLGICIAIPGKKEEPFVLSFNLAMAVVSLLMVAGYVWYATYTAGISKVIQEADVLLMLAPCYYVGVSLWVARQRLPLSQIPAFRMLQGLAFIAAAYMGLAWILSKLRIILFSFLPIEVLLVIVLGLLSVGYLGYQKLIGADPTAAQSGRNSSRASRGGVSGRDRPSSSQGTTIEEELDALRKDIENNNS